MATLPSSNPGAHRLPISSVLSCRQLAKILQSFGDLPLMSGRTDYAITGFKTRPDGLPATTASQVELPPTSQDDDSSLPKEVY